jgi:hypothetical protein
VNYKLLIVAIVLEGASNQMEIESGQENKEDYCSP